MRRWIWVPAVGLAVLWGGKGLLQAQQAPDWILYNGKVVTVDNHGVNANLGMIAQAIAIRDGKIVARGSNDQIRRLAGSNTRSLDLQGRMVTPGFGATHDHPPDWDLLNPKIVQKVITDEDHLERFLSVPPDEVMQQFPRVLEDAVRKAKSGQWIRIVLLFGKQYRWGPQILGFLGRQINKEMLDLAAPNNPVIVRGGFVGTVMNQKAIEETRKFYGDQVQQFLPEPEPGTLDDLIGSRAGEGSAEKTGVCSVCYRYPEQDVLYRPDALREIYRLGLSWMAGYGQTLNATALYTGGAIRAYDTLDRQGQMDMRLGWSWFWPYRNDFFFDPYFVQAQASRLGAGSDYFWTVGMVPNMGMNCSKLPGTSPVVKQRERKCQYDDADVSRALYEYIKAGGRLAGDHIMADGEIDLILDLIEKASKDAGMTLDAIRAKRHVTEHMAMYPRPDQIPRLKNLGMMLSGWDFYIWEGSGKQIMDDYGERGANQVVPRKALYDAGIMNTVEIDRPIGYTDYTYFQVLYSGITRKDMNGNIIAPQQAVSREAMLKSATLWAAYGTLRENVLGSLEVGKWADLVVLDKDYLTVPVEDIPKIRVLMTMVGGKVRHLTPSLATEWGMQPTGAQVELGGPAAQW
ncbi:MAG: amidohydrolase family protein [Acidobacteria bacterium]|nr:amidohydrolase family protein [Acidobacteriota bacterium]